MNQLRIFIVIVISFLFISNIKAGTSDNSGNFSVGNVINKCNLIDDSVTGFGTLTYPSGEQYVGNFKKGIKQGNGYMKFPDGREYYGDFNNDKIEGYGSLVYPNGEKYEGYFKDGKYNGLGTYTSANGEKKAGIFKDNTFTGEAQKK